MALVPQERDVRLTSLNLCQTATDQDTMTSWRRSYVRWLSAKRVAFRRQTRFDVVDFKLTMVGGRRRPVRRVEQIDRAGRIVSRPVQQEIHMRTFEDRALLLLVVAASLAFGWVLWPFYGAILWGIVGAIVFAPLYRRLSQMMRERRSLAAIVTDFNYCNSTADPWGVVGAGSVGRIRTGSIRRTGYHTAFSADVGRASVRGDQSTRSLWAWEPGRHAGQAVSRPSKGQPVPCSTSSQYRSEYL